MKSALPRIIGSVFSLGLLAGCMIVTPHQEVMPSVALECVVLDAATEQPIPGAFLQLIYVGPNGEHVTACEAFTGQDGKAQLQAESQTIQMRGSDWYFAGGYDRFIKARARGYLYQTSSEAFQDVKINQDTPLKLNLEPIRNRYGAALVRAEEAAGPIRTLTFHVLDGPQAGETVSLQFSMPKDLPSCVGKKLYFLRSIKQIKDIAADDGAQYCDSEDLLGEALHDEPYVEVIHKFGEITDAQELAQAVTHLLYFIPGRAPGTTEVTAIRAYTISTLDRGVDWLQFTCDDATLTKLRGFRWIKPVPPGTNKERPGTSATECPPDTPSWWTALAVPPVMEEYESNQSLRKERSDHVVHIWIDPINRTVYAHRRWVL